MFRGQVVLYYYVYYDEYVLPIHAIDIPTTLYTPYLQCVALLLFVVWYNSPLNVVSLSTPKFLQLTKLIRREVNTTNERPTTIIYRPQYPYYHSWLLCYDFLVLIWIRRWFNPPKLPIINLIEWWVVVQSLSPSHLLHLNHCNCIKNLLIMLLRFGIYEGGRWATHLNE